MNITKIFFFSSGGKFRFLNALKKMLFLNFPFHRIHRFQFYIINEIIPINLILIGINLIIPILYDVIKLFSQ